MEPSPAAQAPNKDSPFIPSPRRETGLPGSIVKQVSPNGPVYSVRMGLGYRALAIRQPDCLLWFWIGSHADYDKMLSRL
jgi:hypothetical protein